MSVKPQTLSTLSECHHTSAKALKKYESGDSSPGRKGRGLHPTRRQPAIPADLGGLYSGTLATVVKAGLGTVLIPDCDGEQKVVFSFDFAKAPICNGRLRICAAQALESQLWAIGNL